MDTSLIDTIWQQLRRIDRLHGECSSRLETGWNGRGRGRVDVKQTNVHTLIFDEQGHWNGNASMQLPFRNVYRWCLGDDQIALSHLRFGADHPVFLVDLLAAKDHLYAANPHSCGEDCYDAKLSIQDGALLLEWTVTGPAKDEYLRYTYRSLNHSTVQERRLYSGGPLRT